VAKDEMDKAAKCKNYTMRSTTWIMKKEITNIRKARGGFQINAGEGALNRCKVAATDGNRTSSWGKSAV
jgi:hypothetical protein